MLNVNKRSILLGRLIPENFNFILEDLDSLFKFSKILGGVLNLRNVFISVVLDFFIQSYERTKPIFGLLLLLREIEDEKFFDFELFLGFSHLSHGLGGRPCHLLSDDRQELDFFNVFGLLFLEVLHVFIELCQLLRSLRDLLLSLLQFGGLVQDLIKVDFGIVLQVLLLDKQILGIFLQLLSNLLRLCENSLELDVLTDQVLIFVFYLLVCLLLVVDGFVLRIESLLKSLLHPLGILSLARNSVPDFFKLGQLFLDLLLFPVCIAGVLVELGAFLLETVLFHLLIGLDLLE